MKWRKYGGDVLPLWVAEMDVLTPEPVAEAFARCREHGLFLGDYTDCRVCP